MDHKSSVLSYPLDNSAIVHMAARRRNHTNSFRIAITLREPVCKETLQRALEHITPRFPAVIAGIRSGFFQYRVVPVRDIPKVKEETECLAPMRKNEIRDCAFRVLYCQNRIAAEFFHSLTDGYGGMVVMNILAAEYLRLKYAVSVPVTDTLFHPDDLPAEEEQRDDYFTYAGKQMEVFKSSSVYQLPGKPLSAGKVLVTTDFIDSDRILKAARCHGVSVTVFLCAVMAVSVMEIQSGNFPNGKQWKPVQIMVPVDLRRLFPSRTLRNFSLFALVRVTRQDEKSSFKGLLRMIESQMNTQKARNYMQNVMAAHIRAEKFPLYRAAPLFLKWTAMRLIHGIMGENNSCISLSNLGVATMPEEMSRHVERIEFVLTPKVKSLYNCGVVTYNGKTAINFSRNCEASELEKIFSRKLRQMVQITEQDCRGNV